MTGRQRLLRAGPRAPLGTGSAGGTEERLRRLLEVGEALVSELDPEGVLAQILEEARGPTGARYAALGVVDEHRTELGRLVTSGLDEATRGAIGDLPRGRGVLGLLIADPRPLRLADVGAHPASYGFPAAHQPMRSFLGVAVRQATVDIELETVVYRLVQEALTNFVKHACATVAGVSVRVEDAEVVVEVQDDGRGFGVEARATAFGLGGLRERVGLAGGAMSLRSGADGTRLTARLPVRPRSEAGSAAQRWAVTG